MFRELSKCLSETNADNSSVKGTSMPTARTEEQPPVLDSPKSLNSKPPAETDDIRDYDDKHNGSLYDIAPSNNGECFTAIFYTDQTFKEITELLEQEYKFHPNTDNNGQKADVLLYDKKVIINLYKNKKMVIQGAGSKLWRNSVYRMLTDKLTPRQSLSIKNEHSLDESSDEVVCTYIETLVKHTQTGPVKKIQNKIMNKVCSPGTSSEPKRQNEPIQIPHEVDETVTLPKVVPETSSEKQDSIQSYKSRLEKQYRETKQLQDNLKEMMCQSKLLKSENEKLQKAVVDLKTENQTLKSKLSGCDEKVKETQQQIKTLKSQLAKESGNNLVAVEENNKLKKRISVVTQEKEKLLDQLMQSSTSTESVENKIESELQDFKEIVLEELQEIKAKIESSRTLQNNKITLDIESSQTLPVNNSKDTSDNLTSVPAVRNRIEPAQSNRNKPAQRNRHESTLGNGQPLNMINEHSSFRKTAFIAGDSITSILSTK